LLVKYKQKIDQLREKTKDVLTEEHDDIWLLRYCLSNKVDDKAEKSVRFTIEYRNNNKEWLEKATLGEKGAPHREIMKKYSCSCLHKEKMDGGPVLILRGGLSHAKKLMAELNKEQVAQFLLFQDELAYRRCDKLTRETGKLTKLLVINDMRGFSLLTNSKKFFDALGISTKVTENIFPQLLEKSVAVNPILIYKVLLSLASLVVSKRSLAKFTYCKGDTSKGDITQCPFASKFLEKKDVPTFLGGDCKCEDKGGCVDGIPNEAKEHPVCGKKEKK